MQHLKFSEVFGVRERFRTVPDEHVRPPGQLTRLSTSAKRSREVEGGQSTLLELNVADKRKSCPRGL